MTARYLNELSSQIQIFGDRLHELQKSQTIVQDATQTLDRFLLSLSASRHILSISEDSNDVTYIQGV